jgi:exodeoxyribonuclease V beta subunit
LPFWPVQSAGQDQFFQRQSQPQETVLTWYFDAQPRQRNEHLKLFSAHCADRIVTLLSDETAGFTSTASSQFTPLQASDMAVLVRDRHEARAMQQALAMRGVQSVFLSGNESIFLSQCAQDLVHWLGAAAEPLNAKIMRTALATAMLDWPVQELLQLAQDDGALEQQAQKFQKLNEHWCRQNVLAMLHHTLQYFDLLKRWLKKPGGERQLTDFLHLSELLQAASMLHSTPAQLITWLQQKIHAHKTGLQTPTTEQLPRIAVKTQGVQLMTVHKSKGLEYPLVFLPFACSTRAQETDHGNSPPREDLRLLYVALTRAKYAVWAGVCLLQRPASRHTAKDRAESNTPHSMHLSALGYLLTGGKVATPAAIGHQLEMLCQACPAMQLHTALAHEPVGTGLTGHQLLLDSDPQDTQDLRKTAPAEQSIEQNAGVQQENLKLLEQFCVNPEVVNSGLVDQPHWDTRWQISSFSKLVVHHQPTAAYCGLNKTTVSPDHTAPWHGFAKGPATGQFLHDQLQWLAQEGFTLNTCARQQQKLLQRCTQNGWGQHADAVLTWLMRTERQVLSPIGASLAQVKNTLSEMQFWLPSTKLHSTTLDTWCSQHLLKGKERPRLSEQTVQGMLMGFADLVFEYAGRYWILDYKSNHLGINNAHYGHDALENAMAEHRYDVQAALYLLALHRLLRNRLKERYQPQHHLGGAIMFFLRGLDGPVQGCYVIEPGADKLDALSQLFE